MESIRERLSKLDWKGIEDSLWAFGYARTPAVLIPEECAHLIAMYSHDRLFRSTIHMERFRFGVGEYRYFSYPVPPIVRDLRTHAYRFLAPIANGWVKALGALGEDPSYPRNLRDFLLACRSRNQTKPTPLLLRYEAGGYNCLHQDLYGDLAFPLQLTCFLSRPDDDYGGGEFLLVEQRPRSQSRGHAVVARQGEMVIFTNSWRPVAGRGGYYKANVRHGASTVTRGTRYALGVIFHDAR